MTMLSVAMGVLAILIGYLAYNEAESLACILDHVGIVEDPSCDIVALRGRVIDKIAESLSLNEAAPVGSEAAIDAALAMSPEALTETGECGRDASATIKSSYEVPASSQGRVLTCSEDSVLRCACLCRSLTGWTLATCAMQLLRS